MKKVLLTSKSKAFLERNSSLLVRRGFKLYAATNGAEAIMLHNEHQFDLILADYKLGDMFGYTLCSQITALEHGQKVPLIVITHNIAAEAKKATECGASAVLLKPVDPKKLLETITAFIDLQSLRSKRIAFNADVLCRKSDLEFSCLSRDISNTGILLESDQLSLGSRVRCQFALADSKKIEAEGEVVRAITTSDGKKLYGVTFTDISLSYLRAIISFIVSTATSIPNSLIPYYSHQQNTYA